MSLISGVRLIGTTDASGDVTINAERAVNGFAVGFEWVVDTLAAGVDGTLTVQNTPSGVAKTLLTLTNANSDASYPLREQAVDNTGAVIAGVYDYPIVTGTPRLVIAQGGNAKSGGGILYVME